MRQGGTDLCVGLWGRALAAGIVDGVSRSQVAVEEGEIHGGGWGALLVGFWHAR
jgi:hypothetical protein